MLTYYAHYTICLHTHNTPRIWGLSKPCQYPLGNTPRNWGSRGQNGSGQKRGIAWGTGKIRGFFVPKIIFFWGSNFRGFFAYGVGRIAGKIKNLWGSRVQALSPTRFPRCSHMSVHFVQVVDHMITILSLRENV